MSGTGGRVEEGGALGGGGWSKVKSEVELMGRCPMFNPGKGKPPEGCRNGTVQSNLLF